MKEIDPLIAIGVIKWQPLSKWASPSFIIPKKDHTVHTISDFREFNKRIVRKPYPIPKISTTLQELEGFTYATTLDLNMGYYTIRLDPTAAKMCTIIFPWGKNLYQRLPMGFVGSADIFQAEMGNLMAAWSKLGHTLMTFWSSPRAAMMITWANLSRFSFDCAMMD
jgi:hypothetical protein